MTHISAEDLAYIIAAGEQALDELNQLEQQDTRRSDGQPITPGVRADILEEAFEPRAQRIGTMVLGALAKARANGNASPTESKN